MNGYIPHRDARTHLKPILHYGLTHVECKSKEIKDEKKERKGKKKERKEKKERKRRKKKEKLEEWRTNKRFILSSFIP